MERRTTEGSAEVRREPGRAPALIPVKAVALCRFTCPKEQSFPDLSKERGIAPGCLVSGIIAR